MIYLVLDLQSHMAPHKILRASVLSSALLVCRLIDMERESGRERYWRSSLICINQFSPAPRGRSQKWFRGISLERFLWGRTILASCAAWERILRNK
jgi:hypothetical protein